MNKIKILQTEIEYDAANIRIKDSYKIKNKAMMKLILQIFLMRTEFKYTRTIKSWIKEWKTHNKLYKLGLFRKHTKDCDLEEDEKIHRLIAYEILGIF